MPFDNPQSLQPPSTTQRFLAPNFEQYVPDICHISAHYVLLASGALMSIVEMPNYPFQLEEMQARNIRRDQTDGLYKSVADNNVTIATHLVHRIAAPAIINDRFQTTLGRDLFATRRTNCLTGSYTNTWYLTVIVAPRFTPTRSLRHILGAKRKPVASPSLLRQIKAIMQPILAYVQRDGGRHLGYREADGQRFSEVAEARRLCLYNEWRPVPLLPGPLGGLIYNERITCGALGVRIDGFAGPRYAKVIAFNRYPAGERATRTGQMAHLLDLKCEFVLAQSMRFASRSKSETSIYFRQTHLLNAGVQLNAAAALSEAAEDVQGGETIRGDHNLALIVHARDLDELDVAAGLAAGALDKAGASPIVDDNNAFAAFWSSVAGSPEWMQARAGNIRSDNFTALSEFNGYPSGDGSGPWGRSLVEFKTSADTLFGWQPHVGLLPHALFLGKSRSGKTLLLNTLLMALEQVPARVFYFDYDHCAEPMIRSSDGTYLTLRGAERSGLAPLRGLTDTPETRAFLQIWIAGLMQFDGRGQLADVTIKRLARGVARVMRLPVELRRLGGVRAFLGFEAGGDGSRLDVWCHDGAQGWLFDGDVDEISMTTRMVGWDMTAILKHHAAPAVAAYLLHRIRPEIDGRPAVIAIPETRYYLTAPLFAAIIEDFALGLGKKNAALWMDTQEPQHLLDSSVGASLVSQCASIFQFPTKTADRDTYINRLGFSPAMFKAITEEMAVMPFRSVLLRREDGSVILNIDLTNMPDAVAMLSGTEETCRLIQAIVERFGNGQPFYREFTRQVAMLGGHRA